MNFDELLEQVLALVQREGRVSYRALRRRFNLDEEYLEQYFGQNLGSLIGNDAIVTKSFVIRAGFFQTLPIG